ncbi:hypothetical protein F2Q70_00023709 [Brassica cretica]|uniref:Uncharacterized protein n=1 Tax=Brassica cretica TaxID=69181 RepID=A0A8S9GMC3_BRACR|nr:hypothetical protein F2Q70_00023709 [Brassica cretica]
MFKKIMKGGHKKPSKSESNEPSSYGLGGSNVVVSHASRGALVPSSPVTTAPPPPITSVTPLPLFRDVPVSERQSLFLRKLQNCCFHFDFTDTTKNAREKEIKRQTLLELLSYCIVQFVEKDYKLADTVIRGLLKYWPVTNCTKENLFLQELEEVLEATQPVEFQRCMVPLFQQIARCLNSSHFQTGAGLILIGSNHKPVISFTGQLHKFPVAERALFLWNNEHIVGLIAQNRSVILPIIYPALEKNVQSHWNQAVHGLTANIKKMFMEMDPELFEECQRQYEEKQAKSKEVEEQRQFTWKRLAEAAAERDGVGGGEDYMITS